MGQETGTDRSAIPVVSHSVQTNRTENNRFGLGNWNRQLGYTCSQSLHPDKTELRTADYIPVLKSVTPSRQNRTAENNRFGPRNWNKQPCSQHSTDPDKTELRTTDLGQETGTDSSAIPVVSHSIQTPSLISLMVSVDVKHHVYLPSRQKPN